ncbi:uncharacterized protein ARMOST_16861 [Armillaria ostoyae]|uniref:Heterokaryon incompatibility domain-containing protein n=1 Tax=Armillaria ostoyae TaxID=47428 RepID=A0A284RXE1_ARMOS|nr:uncharacterized protein ARMOST_16861 [Armillaria ostoyae]
MEFHVSYGARKDSWSRGSIPARNSGRTPKAEKSLREIMRDLVSETIEAGSPWSSDEVQKSIRLERADRLYEWGRLYEKVDRYWSLRFPFSPALHYQLRQRTYDWESATLVALKDGAAQNLSSWIAISFALRRPSCCTRYHSATILSLVDPGPYTVNDLSDPLLLSIFEPTGDSYYQNYTSIEHRLTVIYQLLRSGVMSDSYDDEEVTISAFTETGLEESSIIVPLQRTYTGRKPVISSSLADTPCATLGIQGLLDQLNTTLGTSYSSDNRSLSSLLEDCITNDYDFGMAYSRLRRRTKWYTGNWITRHGLLRDALCRMEQAEEVHREWRRKAALIGNRIVDTELPPRRVWDLYSNRVVPEWIVSQRARPISHAWMDEKERAVVWTPINGYEWPVSIPKDANLDLIHIEMLNLGLEYAWLDVLCLRQVGSWREDLRAEEWKVDVPTIGAVYHWNNVVCYLSGLGRPLTLREGDLDSDRSWFRRAWTLQEVGDERVIAGDTPDGPLHAERKDGKYETGLLTRFHKQLQSRRNMSWKVRDALEEMRKRVSTNPVDKIAGLAFLMYSTTIPAYYESGSLEEAWTALVNSLPECRRVQLFLLCPEPGNAGKKWRPSWDQVMKPMPADDFEAIFDVHREETSDEDWCDAWCTEGSVRGLAVVKEGDRHGELIFKDMDGIERAIDITAAHTYPIPNDTYTLIQTYEVRNESSWRHGWVVGRSLPGGKFEKLSVLEMSDDESYRFRWITKKCRYILI